MTEDFLHYLWKYRLIGHSHVLTSGEVLTVLDPGQHNTDSGPDFFYARLRIGQTTWAGNVEIHLRSSDWQRHGHGTDAAYDSVILHVVYQADSIITRRDGHPLAMLELSGKIDPGLFDTFHQLMLNKNWVPCAHLIHEVDRLTLHNWLDRMVAERYERRSEEITRSLTVNNHDWNETFYQFLARSFGFNTNALPFQVLARITPLAVLRRHRGNLFQVEALLFGQSGLLTLPFRTTYFRALKNEYAFLNVKYNLVPMDPHLWKFLRMRPLNFPTVRIAQFAGLMNSSSALFTTLVETDSLEALKGILAARASEFWDGHYSFNSRSPRRAKALGSHAVQLVIINTLVPFLYLYGKMKDRRDFLVRALNFLDQLPAERNAILKGWQSLGIGVRSAYASQALIELKNRYCRRKRCLECAIGNAILRGSVAVPPRKIMTE